MKMLLLSRPITNGGDFLFSERAKELLRINIPEADITVHHLLDDFDANYINSFDNVVIAGGPLYDNRFLTRNAIPFFAWLNEIEIPIHFFCNGWYGSDTKKGNIHSYNFYKEVISDLKYIEEHGGSFSCRDYITEIVLRNNGLSNVYMTGCAAWYDMAKISDWHLRKKDFRNIKKIAISDQGMTKSSQWHDIKFQQLKSVIEFVQAYFPKADIAFSFNGGIDTKYSGDLNRRICEFLTRKGIKYKSLAGSMDGFHMYDDVDLHIGYRVHSHIYCLSQRIPSILIEEDARGGGVNQALGLPRIKNYDINGEDVFSVNQYLLKDLDFYLHELRRENYSRIERALERMQDIYARVVIPYVKNIIGGEY